MKRILVVPPAAERVLQQSLAKWSHAEVVVYVGCGERGDELAEVLQEFPQLPDPRAGASLMERTILIANTSNMPVDARERRRSTRESPSRSTSVTRSTTSPSWPNSTSRWDEALREVSSRLEEMPEEGYPAYLSPRLAEFYERGAVRCAARKDARVR